MKGGQKVFGTNLKYESEGFPIVLKNMKSKNGAENNQLEQVECTKIRFLGFM